MDTLDQFSLCFSWGYDSCLISIFFVEGWGLDDLMTLGEASVNEDESWDWRDVGAIS